MPTGNETVHVVLTVKRDRLDPTPATAPEEFDLKGCQVLPRQAREADGGWVNVDGWDIWCFKDPGRAIPADATVVVRGVPHGIEGTPALFDKRGKFKALKIVAVRAGTAS